MGQKATGQLIGEFCDVPTKTEFGNFIAYADVVPWIAFRRTDGSTELPPDDSWEDAEFQIRRKGEAGQLVMYGYPAGTTKQTAIKNTDWHALFIDPLDGQPDHDNSQHGGRMYGLAYWRDPKDELRLEEAFTSLFFSKAEVLNHWPRHGSGRMPGDGSYALRDARETEKMRELIQTGEAKSARQAALALVDRHPEPGQSAEAKVDRLRKAYRRRYGREPQSRSSHPIKSN